MCGLHWAWVSGLFTGYGVYPNWVYTENPVGPTLDIVWICGLNWACTCFWAVYRVWSGSQLGPNQKAQLGLTLDIMWIHMGQKTVSDVTWYCYIVSYSLVLITIGNTYNLQ